MTMINMVLAKIYTTVITVILVA